MTVAGGCWYDNEEELYELWYEANTCDSMDVSFTEDVFPIIQGNCAITGCHVAGGTGNDIFESYAQIKDKVDNGSLEFRVLEAKNMPPTSPLPDCSRAIIRSWIDAGAPNN